MKSLTTVPTRCLSSSILGIAIRFKLLRKTIHPSISAIAFEKPPGTQRIAGPAPWHIGGHCKREAGQRQFETEGGPGDTAQLCHQPPEASQNETKVTPLPRRLVGGERPGMRGFLFSASLQFSFTPLPNPVQPHFAGFICPVLRFPPQQHHPPGRYESQFVLEKIPGNPTKTADSASASFPFSRRWDFREL